MVEGASPKAQDDFDLRPEEEQALGANDQPEVIYCVCCCMAVPGTCKGGCMWYEWGVLDFGARHSDCWGAGGAAPEVQDDSGLRPDRLEGEQASLHCEDSSKAADA